MNNTANTEFKTGEPGTYQILNNDGKFITWVREFKMAKMVAAQVGGTIVKNPVSELVWPIRATTRQWW